MVGAGVRIDKWLWATRLFKTRKLATEGCASDHVKIEGANVKPSRKVQLEEVVTIRQRDITRSVRVKAFVEKRVGAKLVGDYLEDMTPESEYERQKEFWRNAPAQRTRGTGRPTKKDRREMEAFFDT